MMKVPSTSQRLLDLSHHVHFCYVADAGTDEALGRFLYKNDMLDDETAETVQAKLAFSHYAEEYLAKVGREHRTAENGVFVGEKMYVECEGEPEEVKLDGQPISFDGHTIELELTNSRSGHMVTIVHLPIQPGALDALCEKEDLSQQSVVEHLTTCTGCLVPSAKDWICTGASLGELNYFAKQMSAALDTQLKRACFKALLDVTRCCELTSASRLLAELDEYSMFPGCETPHDYALERMKAFAPEAELEILRDAGSYNEYGEWLIEQHHAEETDYGYLCRKDHQPIETIYSYPQDFGTTLGME